MARHWSAFVNVSEKQARALDKMAADNDFSDGMALLMEVSGDSRSKVQKRDRLTIQGYVDECFKRFGRK